MEKSATADAPGDDTAVDTVAGHWAAGVTLK